jgi:hypothetical protein
MESRQSGLNVKRGCDPPDQAQKDRGLGAGVGGDSRVLINATSFPVFAVLLLKLLCHFGLVAVMA